MNDEHDYITEDLQEFIDEFSKDLLQQSSKIQLPENLRSQSLFQKHGIKIENPAVEVNKKAKSKVMVIRFLASTACFMLILVGYQRLTQFANLTKQTELSGGALPSTTIYSAPMQINNAPKPPVASRRANISAQFVDEYSQIRDFIVDLNLDSLDYAKKSASSSQSAIAISSQITNPNPTIGSLNETSQVESSQLKMNSKIDSIYESDIVKTDGEYIYHYTNLNDNGKVSIVEANNLKLTSSISVKDAQQVELYLQDNLLVVVESTPVDFAISTHAQITSTLEDIAPITTTVSPENGAVDFSEMSSMTKISVYNVENKSDPKQINTLAQDGNYVSSKLVKDNLYVVSSKNTYGNVFTDSLSAATIIPVVLKDSQAELIKPQDIIISPTMQNTNYTVISSINIKNNNAQTKAILGSDQIMMSNESIFITSNILNNATGEKGTGIIKLATNNGTLEYKAGTIVNGYMDSPFSLDEYNGNLRIVTTTSKANNLYVLDANLEQIGILENLAPEKIIYSVRFLEDRYCIVTFENVEMLLIIDLSNPKNPVVKEQLNISDYSGYMHPIGDAKMIGFQVNTYEKNNDELVEDGIKISLFDITDHHPKELFNTIIGNSGTSSEVFNDYRAFMYYPEKNLLGFPVNINTSSNSINSNSTFQGYLVFEVNKDGFQLKAKLSSETNDNSVDRFDTAMKINRAVYIGDNLYTVSDGRLVEYSLSTFTKTNELIYT